MFSLLTITLLFISHGSHGYTSSSEPRVNVSPSIKRRSFIISPSIALSLSFIVNTPKAEALRPKNDALCGTGFFEHIYEYKCTAIGDIEDEGSAKALNSDEMGITDSLIGKLGVSFEDIKSDNEVRSEVSKSKDSEKEAIPTKELSNL